MLEPPKENPKVLGSASEICKAFQIGEHRLNWWRQQPGFPVKLICGRLTGHKEAIEEYMKTFISKHGT